MTSFIPFVFLSLVFIDMVFSSPYTEGDMDYYDRILGVHQHHQYSSCFEKCNGVEDSDTDEKTCIYLEEVNNAGQYPMETTQCIADCLGKTEEDQDQCYCDLCYDGFDKCFQTESAKSTCGCTRTKIHIDFCECNLCPRNEGSTRMEGRRERIRYLRRDAPWPDGDYVGTPRKGIPLRTARYSTRDKLLPRNDYPISARSGAAGIGEKKSWRPKRGNVPTRLRWSMTSNKILSGHNYGIPATVEVVREPVRYPTPNNRYYGGSDYAGSARAGAAMRGVRYSTRS